MDAVVGEVLKVLAGNGTGATWAVVGILILHLMKDRLPMLSKLCGSLVPRQTEHLSSIDKKMDALGRMSEDIAVIKEQNRRTETALEHLIMETIQSANHREIVTRGIERLLKQSETLGDD